MGRGIREEEPDVTVRNVTIKVKTAKAILILKGEEEEEIWLPLSQVREGGTAKNKGDKGSVVISAWISKEKGLSDEGEDDE